MPTRLIKVLALLTASAAAAAQTAAPAAFPTDAQPLTAEALQQRLSGKVFSVKAAAGTPWRLQYQAGGYFYINAGGFSDSGKWRVEGSQVCWEPQKTKAACNDVRLAGDSLYMKRDSGEIVKFEPN